MKCRTCGLPEGDIVHRGHPADSVTFPRDSTVIVVNGRHFCDIKSCHPFTEPEPERCE